MAYEMFPDYEIKIGEADVLEDKYMHQLKALLSPHGAIIDYQKDVAALDLGLHLYRPGYSNERRLGPQRVWMQCKGIQSKSLDAESLGKSGYVPVKGLSLDQIAYWYSAPEPVYLVAYVAAVDQFYLEDVRTLVDEQVGAQELRRLISTQHTTTLRISTQSTLENALEKMNRHQSLRIDYPLFRGKALGHGLDPLRTTFQKPDAATFEDIVNDLLRIYDFRKSADLAVPRDMVDVGNGKIKMLQGRLYSTYEWTSPLFTEYGHDGHSDFRIESQSFHAQGDVVVIVHSELDGTPAFSTEFDELVRSWQDDIEHALVFFNDREANKPGCIGMWRSKLQNLCIVPQGFDSLSYNILTSLPLYTKYFSRLDPYIVSVLREPGS